MAIFVGQVDVKYSYIMFKAIVKVFLLTQSFLIAVYLLYLNGHSNNPVSMDVMSLLERTSTHGAHSKSVFNKVVVSADIPEHNEESLLNVTIHSKNCPNLTPPKLLPSDSTWVPVDDSRDTFVYAAYLVNKNGNNKIVIIGARKNVKRKYVCQLWNRDNVTSQDIIMNFVPATSLNLLESHGKRYSAAFFECSINPEQVPQYVSIVPETCSSPKNILIVQTATNPHEYKRNFTVCLSPLNLQYSRAFDFVEWIELNRILGADKFIVYNQSVARNVSQVLDYYSKIGVVEILPWNIPMSVPNIQKTNRPPEIHYFGQVVALNDCLYRNKKFSKFVVNIDLDEFIIPHTIKSQTWHDLINILPQNNAHLFLNTFFKRLGHGSTMRGASLIEKYQILTLQNIEREERIFKPKVRSKYFAHTSKVFRLMIHEVPGVRVTNVPRDIALLHHYRKSFADGSQKKVYDDTLSVKYGDKLISNIEETWTSLKYLYKLKL